MSVNLTCRATVAPEVGYQVSKYPAYFEIPSNPKPKMRLGKIRLVTQDSLLELQQAQQALQHDIQVATAYVTLIKEGKLDDLQPYEHQSPHGEVLVNSLFSMRDQMKHYNEEQAQRRWVNEGLAKFAEILRSANDLKGLAENVIQQVVRYVDANQGALFVLNDHVSTDPYLEMMACYAFDRKKHQTKRMEIGEGIIGQVYLEKQTVYLTDVPKDFVRITSGLGEAPPRHVLVCPLKLNEEVFGIVELASFRPFEDYQIRFIERLGENIASTISTTKVNERTQVLLGESQHQAEELRSQEEEMRQNMEELAATQEEMQRILTEVQGKEAFVSGLINATQDLVIAIDTEYKLVAFNNAVITMYKAFGLSLEKGMSAMVLYEEGEQRDKYVSFYKRAFAGESFEVTEHYTFQGVEQYYAISYSPLRDEHGQVNGVVSFEKNVTESMASKLNAEALLKESQDIQEERKAQEEALRQQKEELATTNAKLERMVKAVEDKEHLLKQMMDLSSESIVIIDRDDKLVDFNQHFSMPLVSSGIPFERGSEFFAITPTHKHEEKRKIRERVFKGETVVQVEQVVAGASMRDVFVKHAPIVEPDGSISRMVIFSKDLTEVKHLQPQDTTSA
jgi:PAS domain-containing protein